MLANSVQLMAFNLNGFYIQLILIEFSTMELYDMKSIII